MPEIVYVFTNEAMPGYVKIGTTRDLNQRMRELYKTPVPLPFECHYAASVADAKLVERQLHIGFGIHRVSPNREFFEMDPERVVAMLKMLPHDDVTPRNDYVETQGDQQALDKARRRPFNFEMVKISPGTILTFSRSPEITCTVVDNKQVMFENQMRSLTSAALDVLHRRGNECTNVAGPNYWQYEDKQLNIVESLTERRKRLEEAE